MTRTVLPWTGISKTPDQVGPGRRPFPPPLFSLAAARGRNRTSTWHGSPAYRRETPSRSSLVTGKEATSFNQDDVRAKFTGHERDLGVTTSDADDIDSMYARFYNGQIARFLSVDPLQGSPYRPQSMNRYAYVLGSPINFIDPSGLEWCAPNTWCESVNADPNPKQDAPKVWNPNDVNFNLIDAEFGGWGFISNWWISYQRASRDFWHSQLQSILWQMTTPEGNSFMASTYGFGAFLSLQFPFSDVSSEEAPAAALVHDAPGVTPETLMEQLVLTEAQKGNGRRLELDLVDRKYLGMEKWQTSTRSKSGRTATVHFVRDPKTGELMDFKFIRGKNSR